MRSAVVERPGVLRIKQVPEPVVGPNDLLVRVLTASICNATDNHILNGTVKGPHDFYPQILGHEVHGEVIECGSAVKDAPLGKRVVFYTPRGAFCEYTTVDTSSLAWAEVPDTVGHAEAPLCEMFHGSLLHTVYPSGIKDGEKVVVLGQGPMGLVVSQCLKAMADCTIAAVDFQPFRLEKARSLGVDIACDRSSLSAKEIERRIKDAIGEADLAIVCTDTNLSKEEDVYEFAIRLLKPRGRLTGLTVAVKGFGHPVDVAQLFGKQILFRRRLFEAYSAVPSEKVAKEREILQMGVDWVAQGKVDLKALITHRIPLEEVEQGLWLCRMRPSETIKVGVGIVS